MTKKDEILTTHRGCSLKEKVFILGLDPGAWGMYRDSDNFYWTTETGFSRTMPVPDSDDFEKRYKNTLDQWTGKGRG